MSFLIPDDLAGLMARTDPESGPPFHEWFASVRGPLADYLCRLHLGELADEVRLAATSSREPAVLNMTVGSPLLDDLDPFDRWIEIPDNCQTLEIRAVAIPDDGVNLTSMKNEMRGLQQETDPRTLSIWIDPPDHQNARKLQEWIISPGAQIRQRSSPDGLWPRPLFVGLADDHQKPLAIWVDVDHYDGVGRNHRIFRHVIGAALCPRGRIERLGMLAKIQAAVAGL